MSKLTPSRRKDLIQNLSDDQITALRFAWRSFWARADQLTPPGSWVTWLVMSGRGWGKTRVASEFVIEEIEAGRAKRVAIVGKTVADVRDVIIRGESGIIACSPPWNFPVYTPSTRTLIWPNGAIGKTYSADEPDQLRGPQHDLFLADEVAAWRYRDTWDQLMFGLRLGARPRGIATTTPRPIKLMRDIVGDPTTHTTYGSTYDNLINLSPIYREKIVARYEGTTLGRQELYGELLDQLPGALWTRALIDECRVQVVPSVLNRIVVAVDPSVTNTKDSDECGIVVCARSDNGQGYVLEDLTGKMSPDVWARVAVTAFRRWEADRIVAEVNQGGDLVEKIIRHVDPNVSYTSVHASRGKIARAEPIAALYEQHRIHHVGIHAELEDQMCSFTGEASEDSPNHLDAMVWGMSELFDQASPSVSIDPSLVEMSGSPWYQP